MGFNTVVLVLNDALDAIKDDKDFGKRLAEAITSMEVYDGKHKDIPAVGNGGRSVYCNAASVITSHHASDISVVAVGGNCGQVLGHSYRTNYDANKVNILKDLADSMGYTLRRKVVKVVKGKHEKAKS